MAIEVKDVKDVVNELAGRFLAIGLQEAELWSPVLVHDDDLAIEHNLALDGTEILGDAVVFVPVSEIASGVEPYAFSFELGDGTVAVLLNLEKPALAIERLVDRFGEHGFDVPWHGSCGGTL